jgi:signal transduction histidine kinase
MSAVKSHPLWRYGVAVSTTGFVVGLTLLLQPYLKHGVMAIFFASVMVSAWYGGLGPGLVASLLSVLASRYFFFPPIYSFAVHSDDDIAQIVVFSIVTILISALTHAQKRTVVALTSSQSEMKALAEALEHRVTERTAWLALLYDITRSANEAESLGQAFRFTARRLCREDIWASCRVLVPSKESPEFLIPSPYSDQREPASPGAPAKTTRIPKGEGAAGRSYAEGRVEIGPPETLAFPVLVNGSVMAVFECLSSRPLEGSDNLIRLMGAIGLELGQVAGRRQLQEEYADALWQQQRRIAHELHDGLGQELTGLGFLSKSLAVSLQGTSGAESAGRLRQGIERALEQIRGLAKGVMPVELEAEGLMSALRQLSAGIESLSGIPCRFECPNPVLVPDHQTASQLYRIAQEALTNALKHSKASTVTVSLDSTPQGIVLRIHDDGSGLPEGIEKLPGGSGLRIMRYRAGALGASLVVKNAVPKGTEVICRLPATDSSPTA